jgi:hypothetical protein
MNDALAVSCVESVGDLKCVIEHFLGRECCLGDLIAECPALQQFHRDERLSGTFPDVVNGANVRMI